MSVPQETPGYSQICLWGGGKAFEAKFDVDLCRTSEGGGIGTVSLAIKAGPSVDLFGAGASATRGFQLTHSPHDGFSVGAVAEGSVGSWTNWSNNGYHLTAGAPSGGYIEVCIGLHGTAEIPHSLSWSLGASYAHCFDALAHPDGAAVNHAPDSLMMPASVLHPSCATPAYIETIVAGGPSSHPSCTPPSSIDLHVRPETGVHFDFRDTSECMGGRGGFGHGGDFGHSSSGFDHSSSHGDFSHTC